MQHNHARHRAKPTSSLSLRGRLSRPGQSPRDRRIENELFDVIKQQRHDAQREVLLEKTVEKQERDRQRLLAACKRNGDLSWTIPAEQSRGPESRRQNRQVQGGTRSRCP